MRWMWKRTLLVGVVGLTTGGAFGCAEERAPINQVQANALSKSFFVGERLLDTSDDPEFWAQGTVVDVGYGASQDGLFTSTYAQPAARIKWVIQEDLLLGRLTYERIADSDGKGAGKQTDDGIIVVAYPIISHFDIRRDYNRATGEESNVIVENQSDRPWYEREYFRVDWSRNLNVDSYEFDTLSQMGIYGGVKYESLAYFVSDPYHEDAPHFDIDTGYFDVTNKAFATPQLIDLSSLGWGLDKFPACWLDPDFSGGSAPAANCNPVEITIRQSFRRVVDKDYEPAEWDGHRFRAYGAFYEERHGFARNYGMTDTKWHRFITRYNIWERSHAYENPAEMTGATECYTPATTPLGADPHRDENGDGTEDECAAVGRGSRCDTFKQRCTLPYRDRKPVATAWYYTNKSDMTYFDGTDWATHEWDVALRNAVQTAKYSECIRTAVINEETQVPYTDEEKRNKCFGEFPVIFGQMDVIQDAITIAREVDDCRAGKEAYAGVICDDVYNTDGSIKDAGLARTLLTQRGYVDGDPDKTGILHMTTMPQMVVLCHSPVLASDHPSCGENRLPEGVGPEMCDEAKKTLAAVSYQIETEEARQAKQLVDTCNKATARIGDLRFNQVNVIQTPQTPSPWGIYTDTEDPLTGEKVSASINVWSYINDLWSQGVIDTARFIKGDLKTEEVTEGTFVKDWAQASETASKQGIVPPIEADEVDRRIADFAGMDVEEYKILRDQKQKMLADLEQGGKPSIELQTVNRLRQEIRSATADINAPSANRAVYDARRKLAMGTPFEAELTTKAMQQYAGVDKLPIEQAMTFASPMRAANPSMQREIRQMREAALAEHGSCIMHEAPAPVSMTGLTDLLEKKFGAFADPNDEVAEPGAPPPTPAEVAKKRADRRERMRRYIAQRAHYAVIIHEMGHSVGLRHNFVSSSDSSNYRPQYWQLRTKDGAVKSLCNQVSDGEACVGPRYFDPVTQEERDNLIWMFMHSSVMDYAGEATQDLLGLGTYDFAAARMFYGEAVAVYQNDTYSAKKSLGKAALDKMDQFGGLLGFQYTTNGSTQIHYSQLNDKWKLISDCAPVDPQVWKPKSWNEETQGVWDPLLDGQIVNVNGQYTRCKTQKVDYVQWQALGPRPTPQDTWQARPMSRDASERVRVPYGFATDRWADLGNVSVYRHDNGADPYEQFTFFINQQELGHIFDNYRRNRQSFSVRNAANRILGRYSTKMRDGAKGLTLLRNIYVDFGLETNQNPETLWASIVTDPSFRDVILTSGVVFDHFARSLARPEPGGYYDPCEIGTGPDCPFKGQKVLRSKMDVYFNDAAVSTMVTMPNGAFAIGDSSNPYENVAIGGKPLGNALANDKGEYDAEYTINAGSYYDKVNVSMLMTESVDNFISDSRKDFLDSRYRATSLADLFPEGYRRMLANSLTGDDFLKGPRVSSTSGKPNVDAQGYPTDGVGWVSWWPLTGPEVCFPKNGTTVCNRYGEGSGPFDPEAPAEVMALDGQVGWEQQKFLIAWTMMYLPENQKLVWLNQLRLWERTQDDDPPFDNRIEFHDPNGSVYIAKTFGTETIFGKVVQQGIAARVLEYANSLLVQGYETVPVTLNGVTWYEPVVDPATGMAIVKKYYADDTDGVTEVNENPYALKLAEYTSVVSFLRQAVGVYQLADPSQKGLFDL